MIIILLLSVFPHFSTETVVLHKCCGNGTQLQQGRCVPSKNLIINDDWFPKNALFTPGGERLSEENQNDVMKWIMKNAQYGAYNFSCKIPMFSIFERELEDFRILVEDANNVNVEITQPDDEDITFDENGSSTLTIPLQEVCVDFFGEGHMIISCPGHSTPWFRKCCPPKQLFNVTSRACSKYPGNKTFADWKPQNASGLLKKYFLVVPNEFTPLCKTYSVLRSKDRTERCRGFNIPETKFQLQANGSVKISSSMVGSDEYCVDKTWHGDGELIHQNVLYCREKREIGSLKGTYGGLFLFGGFLLMATVIISLLLPELRQRIHNKIAITHNATLMCAHFVWAIVLLLPMHVSITMCCILCLSLQFTFLGSLFWMNAMCINLSSTFQATRTISIKGWEGETRKYCIYSAYAWGLTFLISVFTITMEFIEKPPLGLPRPGFSCFCDFHRNSFSVFIYFYGPMVVLLIFNLVLYVFTTLKIMSVVRESQKILQQADSKTTGGTLQSQKQMLILYTKLFFLMGITWMTEIIGWTSGASTNNVFLIILDIINVLRAVFIFVLFVCKPRILRKVRDYFLIASGRLRRSGSFRNATGALSMSGYPSRQEEANKNKSKKEWIHMKPMDRSKDKAFRVLESAIPEEPEESI